MAETFTSTEHIAYAYVDPRAVRGTSPIKFKYLRLSERRNGELRSKGYMQSAEEVDFYNSEAALRLVIIYEREDGTDSEMEIVLPHRLLLAQMLEELDAAS